MAKTNETLRLEEALRKAAREKREYGCEEVTIGFKKEGHGDEIVDFMSMDASDTFRCYEIKVTLADLKTDNKKSWYGEYNYLVVSDTLWARHPDWDEYIPPYTGILSGESLMVRRKAKQREIAADVKDMLKSSLLRSVYWKMMNWRDSGDLAAMKDLAKKCSDAEEALEKKTAEYDRLIWTYHDLERYYRLNHGLKTFSLEAMAKEERRQYMLRKQGGMSWIAQAEDYTCPVCGKTNKEKTDYCPHCGSDLKEKQN